MGCLLAARLVEAGRQVVLLDRDPARAARLSANGLWLEDLAGERRIPIRAVASLEGVTPRLVFLCVKARATAAATRPLVALPGEVTLAVLQNGLGGCEAAGESLGNPDRIVGILTVEGATSRGEGRVRLAGRGPTVVGALTPGGEARAAAVVEALCASGWAASEVPSAELEQRRWEKLQVNAAINALTGLLGCRNGGLLEAASAAALADAAAVETALVATARGVPGDWSEEAARARWRAVARETADNVSSTLQDLREARPTEVFVINGAVAEAAKEAGFSASVNAHLALLIAAREQRSQGDP